MKGEKQHLLRPSCPQPPCVARGGQGSGAVMGVGLVAGTGSACPVCHVACVAGHVQALTCVSGVTPRTAASSSTRSEGDGHIAPLTYPHTPEIHPADSAVTSPRQTKTFTRPPCQNPALDSTVSISNTRNTKLLHPPCRGSTSQHGGRPTAHPQAAACRAPGLLSFLAAPCLLARAAGVARGGGGGAAGALVRVQGQQQL